MILPSRLTIGLGVALGLSLVANAFLGWQWAQGEAECKTDIADKTLDSVGRVGEAAADRDKTARGITKDSDARATQVAAEADTATLQTKEKIVYVYRQAPADSSRDVACAVVRPVPDGVQRELEAAAARANR